MFRMVVRITAMAAIGLTACGGDQDDPGAATRASSSTAAGPSAGLDAWCDAYNTPADFEEEDDLQTVFEAIQARAEAVAAVAPAEIAEASDVAAERGRTLNEHIASYDWDPESPRADARVERDLFRANKEKDEYAEDNCDVATPPARRGAG